jgi:hypothetical protein
MGDLDKSTSGDIEQLRGQVGEVIALVLKVLAQVDEVLAKVETSNRQMFATLQAQTDAGFARLRASIDAVSRTERKDDEPPKLN